MGLVPRSVVTRVCVWVYVAVISSRWALNVVGIDVADWIGAAAALALTPDAQREAWLRRWKGLPSRKCALEFPCIVAMYCITCTYL